MQSSARISAQQVIIYVAIGVVLVAAVIAVIFWAKNRSGHYAAINQAEQSAPEAPSTDEGLSDGEPAAQDEGTDVTGAEDSQDQTAATENQEQTASTGDAGGSNPPVVPSTGPGDYLLSVGALSTLAFAGFKYSQSRRRLTTLQ